jgi:hypothetical protein
MKEKTISLPVAQTIYTVKGVEAVLVVIAKADGTCDITINGDTIQHVMRLLGGALSATRTATKRFPPDGGTASDLIEQAMALIGISDDATYDPSKKTN